MYHLSSIEIDRFRDEERRINIPLDGEVNFFIGRNGTGKTTLMNLLHSALAADVRILSQAKFSSITFRLRRSGDKKRPYIRVTKTADSDGDDIIEYQIAEGARSKPDRYSIPAVSPTPAWRMMSTARSMPHYYDPLADYTASIKRGIAKLVSTSWISVHRAAMASPNDGEERYESPVDRKLHQVAREFGTYFSVLDKQAAEETDKFQQVYLLSLISPSGFDSLSSVGSVNADEEKSAIRGMFAEFNIKSSVYSNKLENFSKRMSKALANYKPNSALAADDFLVLTDTIRIHDAVKEWHRLLDKRAKIYKPKDDFVSIVTDLFFRKKLSINAGNQPVFTDLKGDPLSLDNLSSGEKQLFILLGETLLQRRSDCIFMADEPEISLHIDWQERLVPSLRRINPNAQILFATHSPDVVGAYGPNAIDLEKVI